MKALALTATCWLAVATSQTIEFDSGGLTYQAQTQGGVTVMVAPLTERILGYSIVQVAVSNGSSDQQVIQPQMFLLQRTEGAPIRALSAEAVVTDVLDRAGRGDVSRLITVYEAALFGNIKMELRHGYEARRRDAMGIGGNTRMRAATAAAAIVLGSNKLSPGAAVDGAVLFPTSNRPLGAGLIVVEAAGQRFEFKLAPAPAPAR